ncbi:MAG: cytochrome C552, partial [Hyphomicrobiales bacterium]|nr:cytochrome C552 [Hyphomicrobiales bacterium]
QAKAAAAIAAAKGETPAPTDTATSGGSADGLGAAIDWSAIDAKAVTLFYPGQTSFEWVQTGKDHGGARAFTKGGDRCSTCHAKEVKDMGAKLVSGEKAEETPIPGKRPFVEMTLQAAHDAENLYLHLQWADGDHAPVPFVDGGKLDPDNQAKVAMMIAGTGIEYADRAGCWVTCHHDSRYMPDAPKEDALAGAGPVAERIDITHGITKYLAESRTKVEVAGRRGKVRGGWDQLKDAGEVDALRSSGAIMDLVRFRSGADPENGSVLAERRMQGGGAVSAEGKLEAGQWTVVLSRPLAAGDETDIAIEAGKTYVVGFAIHDDFASARFHHVSLEYTFALDDPAAEINVVGK